MSFVQREIDRLRKSLASVEPTDEVRPTPKELQLLAALQALYWVGEPGGYKSPNNDIMGLNDIGYELPLAESIPDSETA